MPRRRTAYERKAVPVSWVDVNQAKTARDLDFQRNPLVDYDILVPMVIPPMPLETKVDALASLIHCRNIGMLSTDQLEEVKAILFSPLSTKEDVCG
jgi:hypothetical protein